MKPTDYKKELKKGLESSIEKLEKAKKEKKTILAQTIYLGTVGIMFILPVIIGAYVGVWLDNKYKGFSFSWTISLIFLGIAIGVINVYRFMKD